ncbi:MAG: hypothetical protein ACE5PT_10575 [Gemmatimonadales bacterium]
MHKIKLSIVAYSGFACFVGFVVAELALEGIALLAFNVSERDLLSRYFDVTDSGFRYHFLNLTSFLVECIIIMWVYGLARAALGSAGRGALVTIAIAMGLVFIPVAHLALIGVVPAKVFGLSLGFNVVELPFAILIGAALYEARSLPSP